MITSFLCKAIDQQAVFLAVLNKEQECTCVYARMVSKLVVEKLTQLPHFGAISFIQH